MGFIKQFISEVMHVMPLGEASYEDGIEYGEKELLVDGQNTGIYFSMEDYAMWLEKQLKERDKSK